MKSDMIAEIISALGGVPRHVVLKMVMRKLLKALKILDLVVRKKEILEETYWN